MISPEFPGIPRNSSEFPGIPRNSWEFPEIPGISPKFGFQESYYRGHIGVIARSYRRR